MKKLVSLLLCFLVLFSTLLSGSASGIFMSDVMYGDFKAIVLGEGGSPRLILTEYLGNSSSVNVPTTITANEMVSIIPDSDKILWEYEEFILNEIVSGDMLIEICIGEELGSCVEIVRYKNYVDKLKVFIDGKEIAFEQEPIISDNRTLVPLRAIFESLGAVVVWEEQTRTAIAAKSGATVTVQIDNNKMFVNEREVLLDVAPQIVNNRTLVPVRAISEAFNCTVYWDAEETNVIIIDRAPLTGDVIANFYYDAINGNLTDVEESTSDGNSSRTYGYDGNGGFTYKYIIENGVEIEHYETSITD